MGKKLVAYFSATGETEKLARKLAVAIDADMHRILPVTPYTAADLDWSDSHSRSTVEMQDRAFRPAIVNRVSDMAQYDTIFIGFPIWWYTAPTIINSFLESYDFSGKTIIPFATSGSSSMGRTNDYLAASCKGAILKEGKRFPTHIGERELADWAQKQE